jgi:hypothetical protein
MSTRDKLINYVSMALGGILGFVLGILIYKRTMERAAEIAREEALENGTVIGDEDGEYADAATGLLDPEDVAQLMNDDDISLWDNDDTYRDEDSQSVEMGTNIRTNGFKNDSTNGSPNGAFKGSI